MPPRRRYRVQRDDSYATFPNPQQVMNLNPGVPTLSPGQTIWVPGSPQSPAPNNTFGPLVANNGYVPPPSTPANFNTANSFSSGAQVNTGAFNVGAPQISPGFANQPEFTSPGGINSPVPSVFPTGGGSFFSTTGVNTANTQIVGNYIPPANNAGLGVTTPNIGAPGTNQAGYAYNTDAANTDPRNTAAYRQYAAEGTAFVNQQRWDPERGGFVRIGQLINEGRLDVRDSQARLRRRRGGGGGGEESVPVVTTAAAPEVQQGNMVNSGMSWRVG